MVKKICSFVAGIIFTVFVFIFLSHREVNRFEESGAVISHAGICEGRSGNWPSYLYFFLTHQENIWIERYG